MPTPHPYRYIAQYAATVFLTLGGGNRWKPTFATDKDYAVVHTTLLGLFFSQPRAVEVKTLDDAQNSMFRPLGLWSTTSFHAPLPTRSFSHPCFYFKKPRYCPLAFRPHFFAFLTSCLDLSFQSVYIIDDSYGWLAWKVLFSDLVVAGCRLALMFRFRVGQTVGCRERVHYGVSREQLWLKEYGMSYIVLWYDRTLR